VASARTAQKTGPAATPDHLNPGSDLGNGCAAQKYREPDLEALMDFATTVAASAHVHSTRAP